MRAQVVLTDADVLLAALGICSGDMLWVHTAGDSAATIQCAPSAPPAAAATASQAPHAALAATMPASQQPPRQAAGDAAEARRQAAAQVCDMQCNVCMQANRG